MTKDRAALLGRFSDALGALVAEGLSELNPEKARQVDAALRAGTAKVQVAVNLDPLSVVCFLRHRDLSEPAHQLFAIGGSSPSAPGTQ